MVLRLLFFLFVSYGLSAQWQAGSLYKEYHFVTPEEGEAFLRVGGRYGYQAQPDKLPDSLQRGNWLLLPGAVDLDLARKAEVVIERVQSHENSKGLSIRWNEGAERFFGLPNSVPDPADEYMFHLHQKLEIPLWELRRGQNRFQFQIDSVQRWEWPQNLIYGLTLRVYYAPEKSSLAPPRVNYSLPQVPANSEVSIVADANLVAIDYALEARDMDWRGDGIYRRIHWQTHRGKPFNTLGSSEAGPEFSVQWNTDWLPNQRFPMRIYARGQDKDGLFHVGPASHGLVLAEREWQVALITPTEVPRNWVTRSGSFAEKLQLSLDPEQVTDYQLLWNAWSPCYANGIFLNGHLLWKREGECYVFAPLTPIFRGYELSFLQKGGNVLRTALTPRFNGQMVHGMEVQWPGILLKVRYK